MPSGAEPPASAAAVFDLALGVDLGLGEKARHALAEQPLLRQHLTEQATALLLDGQGRLKLLGGDHVQLHQPIAQALVVEAAAIEEGGVEQQLQQLGGTCRLSLRNSPKRWVPAKGR